MAMKLLSVRNVLPSIWKLLPPWRARKLGQRPPQIVEELIAAGWTRVEFWFDGAPGYAAWLPPLDPAASPVATSPPPDVLTVSARVHLVAEDDELRGLIISSCDDE